MNWEVQKIRLNLKDQVVLEDLTFQMDQEDHLALIGLVDREDH